VGDPVVPKQHKEYWKKNALMIPQSMLVDESTGNLITNVTGGTNVVLHLGPLDSDKADGGISNVPTEVTSGTNVGLHLGPLDSDKANGDEDDFANMPPLEDASDHDRSSPK